MGSNCGKNGKIGVTGTLSTKASFIYHKPDSINDIMGTEVDRQHPAYLYAHFCVTRLVDKYKFYMFPDVAMGVGSFREDIRDYMAVVNEIYNDLGFVERTMPSKNNIDPTAEQQAKRSITMLAYRFMRLESCGEKESSPPSENEISESFKKQEYRLEESELFENCYEDTLKMLITDLERKEIWQLSTLFSHKEFQVLLQELEPETYQELADDSFEIQVPAKGSYRTATETIPDNPNSTDTFS